MLPLLDQLTTLAKQQQGVPVIIDYEHLVRCVVRVFREEWEKAQKNSQVIISQAEAYERYNRSVITNLVARGKLQQHRYECKEILNEEGTVSRIPTGKIFYRISEIEHAIEDANLYKGTRRVSLK